MVPYRAIIYALMEQTLLNDGFLVQFCKQYFDRLYACIDAIKELLTYNFFSGNSMRSIMHLCV